MNAFEHTRNHWTHYDTLHSHQGKGEDSREKEEKGRRRPYVWRENPLYNHTVRTHARTKRRDFPAGVTFPGPDVLSKPSFWNFVE